MDNRARRAALRAAFNIAFASPLLGCAGEVVVEPSGDLHTKAPSPPSPAEPAETPAEPADEAPVACAAPEAGWEVYQEDTFACCVPFVQDVLSEHGDLGEASLGDRAQATYDCCTQVTRPNAEALWSNLPPPYPAPEDVLASCCQLTTGTPSCTPWGPPAPPAMLGGDDLGWLDEARRGAA